MEGDRHRLRCGVVVDPLHQTPKHAGLLGKRQRLPDRHEPCGSVGGRQRLDGTPFSPSWETCETPTGLCELPRHWSHWRKIPAKTAEKPRHSERSRGALNAVNSCVWL